MQKQILSFSLLVASSYSIAATPLDLYHAPITSLAKFKRIDQLQSSAALMANASTATDSLQAVNQTKENDNTLVRYQQFYKNIPIIGAQVIVVKNTKASLNAQSSSQVNGRLFENLQLDTKPSISSQDALKFAKQTFLAKNPQALTTAETSQLQIRADSNDELTLTYLVTFKSTKANGKAVWPFFVINAHTGAVINQWNNLKNYLDTGPGGNEKVHEYWYGKDGLPALDVKQEGGLCVMESAKVRLVDLKSLWDDGEVEMPTEPYKYTCNENNGDYVNGAFSPSNDAYYFGHTIVDMYKNWYGLNALQNIDGSPMQLVMRVHYGQGYDNAFWDGQSMTFGDGNELFPLVSLDIAGHEVTHGFTEQHSGLEYHDQSGALNESLSDMGGQATRAYLLETSPALYNRAHLVPNKLSWAIGDTVMRGQFGTAIRYMDQPSSDGDSADCLDKALARRNKASCVISYRQLLETADQIEDLDDRQSYIVHTASGIYNKAFYLLSKKIGVKQAYQLMTQANVKHWGPMTNFRSGACGVIYSARELSIDEKLVTTAFGQVGIDTKSCQN